MADKQLSFAQRIWRIVRIFNDTEAYAKWLKSTGVNDAKAEKVKERMQTTYDMNSKYDWSGRQDKEISINPDNLK